MNAEAGFIRTWRVGRFTVTLTCPRPAAGTTMAASVEWAPDQPRRLTEAELRAYRAGRNAALEDLAVELGVNVAVLEV
ncbi:MAG: hypothetical protein J0M00_06485 [Burkholderiales bacterium]|nr:hypothetical protein [Burkholderiales bacterium]